MSDKPMAESIDGRRKRSERSRQAFIDAALALVEEGHLVPTANMIAGRAGIGIRSFFRHFPDMETLFTVLDHEIRDSVEAQFVGGDRQGSLEERVLQVVERHAHGYESEKNIILSTAAQSWRFEVLRKNYARYQRGLRRNLQTWLPELQRLPASRVEAADAVTSFEMWHRLRHHQGLSKKAAIELVAELLTDLLVDD
ncbi:MAG: TetR/AcrR family transcriptional regulator [Pseudomonadota bacterium]